MIVYFIYRQIIVIIILQVVSDHAQPLERGGGTAPELSQLDTAEQQEDNPVVIDIRSPQSLSECVLSEDLPFSQEVIISDNGNSNNQECENISTKRKTHCLNSRHAKVSKRNNI